FLVFYIPWNVEVKFIGFNFLQRNHSTITRNFYFLIKHIGYMVNILFAQSIFVSIFYKTFSTIYHKNAISVLRPFFINDNNTSWDSRSVEQVGRQTNNTFDVASFN